MNTRHELAVRLAEIQKAAASLPGHEAPVPDLHYALCRLSSWVTRTVNFVSTMEDQHKQQADSGEDKKQMNWLDI